MRSVEAPLDTATMARRLDLHPNGIRVQLRRLERSGLVTGEPAQGAVGRPPILWRLTPQAVAQADRPYAGWSIARSLARAIPATPSSLDEVERAGVQMGAELAHDLGPAGAAGAGEPVEQALAALGFDPERSEDGTVARYRLRTCPYAEAVRENPAVVCTLHRGMIRGLLEQVAPQCELTGFEPRPPDVAGCIVEITASSRQKTAAERGGAGA